MSRRDLGLVLVFVAAAGLLLLWMDKDPPPPEPTGVLLRDQVFFASDDGSLVLTLVVQREKRDAKALIEVKTFAVLDRSWQSPLYETVQLERWPGSGAGAALEAWAEERPGPPLRLSWEEGVGLRAELRSAAGLLRLDLPELEATGEGEDPHGPLRWRAGRGSATLDDRSFEGVAIHELLDGQTAIPSFGRFELWVLRPPGGGLVLGRASLPEPGRALVVDPSGDSSMADFQVEPGDTDPLSWSLRVGEELASLAWLEGSESEGLGPDGQPARYAIGHVEGDGRGLVFHLEDGAR